MTRVLVLDGNQRSTLAIVRGIAQRYPTEIFVAESRIPCLAGQSRFANRELSYPDPATHADDFIAWIRSTVDHMGIRLIIPTTDITTMLLAPLNDTFTTTSIACAPHSSYELVSDKARLVELASTIGVEVPITTVLNGRSAIDDHLSTAQFPLVIKPARSKIAVGDNIISTAVHIADSAESARHYLDNQRWLEAMPCLVQRFIEGHGAGVFTCFADGKAVTWFSHRRLREKPPSGGVSVLSESIRVPASMQLATSKLLVATSWHGLAMVEFRVAEDGTPYLMEINARPWGSMQLAIDAGVNFPALMFEVAMRIPISTVPPPKWSRRLRWLLGDVDNLILQVRDGRHSLLIKVRAITAFIATFFDLGCHQEIFRWSDPRPAFHELRQWVKALR